ncbi:sodium/potassium-transporting ATPase subunit beta-like isoform X2 [Frieseomelitta varia]|uniref:sodium/potassium-transporting ATPase subunit beta-like isoform X2 n=1 Tax=Frieseomelitta varia TaxID=561572 RepID=UPI001CB6AAB1|nr:sodium/potassium-transporting ATPase subunit beta-like isoform X2 [Frieseomelitta varia]
MKNTIEVEYHSLIWDLLETFCGSFGITIEKRFSTEQRKNGISIDYVSKLDRPYFQHPGLSSNSFFGVRVRHYRSTFGSPGIVFKPNSVLATSPIISVNNSTNTNNNNGPERYIRALSDFLQEYRNNTSNYDFNCLNQPSNIDHNKKPCFFDITSLGKCSKPPYGYAELLQPCVLIKFNKRFDWVPEYYNRSSNLPENMPSELKQAVQRSPKPHIWLSCDGANNVDKEHIGKIEYIPLPGFPVQYFPFTGQPGYLSPIVALEFKNLTPNRLVTVECYLWAYNVEQRSRYSLDFQIIIESQNSSYNY